MAGLTVLTTLEEVVTKVSPLLGTVLGSPLAGIAISLLGNLFNVPKNDTNAILEAINNDSSAADKIKGLELQHQEILMQYVAQDRANARAREVSIHDHVPAVLAIVFTCSYLFVSGYCLYSPSSLNDTIISRFQDIMMFIVGYYYGDAFNTKNKDKN